MAELAVEFLLENNNEDTNRFFFEFFFIFLGFLGLLLSLIATCFLMYLFSILFCWPELSFDV